MRKLLKEYFSQPSFHIFFRKARFLNSNEWPVDEKENNNRNGN
jgi:hypothetical protein